MEAFSSSAKRGAAGGSRVRYKNGIRVPLNPLKIVRIVFELKIN